jgi:hypothetical protein
MRKVLSVFIAVCVVLSLFTGVFAPVRSARADAEGVWNYTVAGGEATITGYTGPGGAVVIPSTIGVGPYPVTGIGNSAFNSTQGHLLTSVTIPNSVTSLGTSAFAFCTGLTSVTIPNSVSWMVGCAFWGCTGLTSVTIGSGVAVIGLGTFQDCTGLTSVTVPNSVTSLGTSAFAFCTGLTSVTIGSGVTAIGASAFLSCTKLTAAYFLGNAPTMGTNVFFTCAAGFTVRYVSGTTGWTNPWYTYPTGTFTAYTLSTTAFPSVGGSIARSPDASSYAPGTVVTLTANANPGYHLAYWGAELTGTTNPTTITMDGDKTVTAAFEADAHTDGDYVYILNGTVPETATITGYSGLGGVVIIPGTLGGYPVTSIGYSAFSSCTALTSVTIPNTVTKLEAYAFTHCTGLSSVVIPDSVITIGGGAFYECTALSSVTIGSGVVTINMYAFYHCTMLVSAIIPNSVTWIGACAFRDCTALASAVIGGGVASIEVLAFAGCTALTSVTIPNSVTNIGSHAFQGCAVLDVAYFFGNAPTMGTEVFRSCGAGFTVWCMSGTTGWTNPWCGYATTTFSSLLVLSASWNLVSVAVPLPVSSITGLQSVYGYHNNWSVPTTLIPGQAYWVQVQNAVTVPLPGTPSTTPVSLTYQVGWQLLGNPFDAPLPIGSITNHGLITTCYSYGPNWGSVDLATGVLQPGKGYWINLSAATTLTLTHP